MFLLSCQNRDILDFLSFFFITLSFFFGYFDHFRAAGTYVLESTKKKQSKTVQNCSFGTFFYQSLTDLWASLRFFYPGVSPKEREETGRVLNIPPREEREETGRVMTVT